MVAFKTKILGEGSFIGIRYLRDHFLSLKPYSAGLQNQMVLRKEKKILKNKTVNSNPEILTSTTYLL